MWKIKIGTFFKSGLETKGPRIGVLCIGLSLCLFLLAGCEEEAGTDTSGSYSILADREQYRPLLQQACLEEGIPEYEDLLMAIMSVESGGSDVSDVMQSSESLGLPRNSLGVEESIRQGVAYFKAVLEMGMNLGLDIRSVVQAYNFGPGFLNYMADSGEKEYSQALAEQYSAMMKEKLNRKVYGSPSYVASVSRFFSFLSLESGGSRFAALMEVALRYQGVPYVFGGSSPEGFDCSGMTQYVYREIGVQLPRSAQEQYRSAKHISIADAQPGDLVFFCKTYQTSSYITHVAIYVGDGRIYHAGSKGVGYANLETEYWQEHFVGFGRVW